MDEVGGGLTFANPAFHASGLNARMLMAAARRTRNGVADQISTEVASVAELPDRAGNSRFVHVRARSVQWDGRRSLLCVAQDVTSENDLRAQLNLRERALEAAANGIVIARADGDMPLIYVNTAFQRMTGYSWSEAVGGNCRFLQGSEDCQPERARLRAAIDAGRPCSVTLCNYRKSGEPFWNHLTIAPVREDGGAITHFVGIQEDVTERIRTERDAAQARAWTQSILDTAPDAIITVDESRRITAFNRAAEQMFGWRAEDVIGEDHGILLPEAMRDRHASLAKGYVTDGPRKPGLMAARTVDGRYRDGTVFPVQINLSNTCFGERTTVTAIARDMTELERKNRDLARLSVQLEDQLRKVEEANQAKTQFLATMSHELRTPLNAVIGFAELMEAEPHGPLGDARYKGYLADIHKSGQLLLSLINNLLDMTRIERGKYEVDHRELAPRPLVQEALRTVRAMAQEAGVRLRGTARRDLPRVRADHRALVQVLLNLLSNALQFTPPGRRVMLSAEIANDGGIVFTVSDEGCGIPQDKIAQLGQPFQRLGNAYRAETSGTGLGLAISRRLTEIMGGELTIESAIDVGTRVSVRLPGPNAEGMEAPGR